jgi:hypothetical protein
MTGMDAVAATREMRAQSAALLYRCSWVRPWISTAEAPAACRAATTCTNARHHAKLKSPQQLSSACGLCTLASCAVLITFSTLIFDAEMPIRIFTVLQVQ